MKKSNRMYMVTKLIGFTDQEVTRLALDWLSLIRILITPVKYKFQKGAYQAFDAVIIEKLLSSLTATSECWVQIVGTGGEFQLQIADNTIHEQAIIDYENFLSFAAVTEDYLDQRIKQFGVYGYLRSFDEFLANNVAIMEKRMFNTSEEMKGLPKRYTKEQKVIIDCNQLAGFDLFYEGLCFTACWKIYITSFYYRLIPQPIFAGIQRVHEIEALTEQVLKITLHKDPLRWDQPVNLQDQRMLRSQLGVDQLAWSNGIGVLREPYIEFAYLDDTIQTVQYQNRYFQPVPKKQATYFVTRSYDFLTGKATVNRTKGKLNAQAYFPWIDQQHKKMMNYRVLDPELTLDNGLAAYEFYIRQFLEIEVADENYRSFLSVLRFYLPEEALEQVPLEALYDQLEDMNILNLKKEAEYMSFDVRKAKNHLRVMFLDYNQLGELTGLLRSNSIK
ncbi:hypothetical protein ACSFB8_03405 [Enterococcus faecalis]